MDKNWIQKYWQIVLFILLIAFNVGFTKAQLDQKVDKAELQVLVVTAIEKFADGQYVKIDQVPGLEERLKNIENGIEQNRVLMQKIYDKILSGKYVSTIK